MSRTRNVCFTLNNYTTADIDKGVEFGTNKCTYLVYGEEIGELGTPHLQGYLELNDPMSFSALQKKLFTSGCHLESRGGNSKQAAGYCKKGSCPHAIRCPDCEDFDGDHSFWFTRTAQDPATWSGQEIGTISTQGKRSDISAPTEMIVEGNSMRQVAVAFPEQIVKYHKGFTALKSLLLPPRSLDALPTVIVHFGPTGTGKSKDAYLALVDTPYYEWEPDNGDWWCGYDGELAILMEEFRGQMKFGSLLKLLDRNACRRAVKGGQVQIQANTIYITSPVHPSLWYNYSDMKGDESIKQLSRRITKIIEFPLKVEVPF